MKKIIVATLIATLGLAGSAGAVSAGEITGNGTLKEVHGKSICAFSGQNDGYHIPELAEPEELPNPSRVQSFGQEVRHKRIPPKFFNPGDACNPNAGGH